MQRVSYVVDATTKSLSFLKVCLTMIDEDLSTNEGDTPQESTYAEEISCLACETVRREMFASGRFDDARGSRRTTQVTEAARVRGHQDAHKALQCTNVIELHPSCRRNCWFLSAWCGSCVMMSEEIPGIASCSPSYERYIVFLSTAFAHTPVHPYLQI